MASKETAIGKFRQSLGTLSDEPRRCHEALLDIHCRRKHLQSESEICLKDTFDIAHILRPPQPTLYLNSATCAYPHHVRREATDHATGAASSGFAKREITSRRTLS